MKITFHPNVQKQLQVFPAALHTIIALTHNPQPVGVKKLVGSRDDWRVRIGEHRIIYEINDAAKTITVLQVEHRRNAYR
ncbi:MAG: type II toxin-antitoxin system RelE family toxin [Pseudonocardiaceae bacterium]